jgi:hypothetical protein
MSLYESGSSSQVEWVIAFVELIGIFVAYFVGRKQGRDNERAYQLSLQQATPRIGSRVEFIQGPPASQGNQFRYTVKATIYNDGGLVASKLDGNWKLSSSYSFLNGEDIVRADSLPSFLPVELERNLGYHSPNTWTETQVVLQVDIDLVYLGLHNKQEKYQATYKFNPKSQKMIQILGH